MTAGPYLGSVGTGHGCNNLGDLSTGAVNSLSSRVVHISDILVLKLGALPDLDFASAAEHTHTHGRQEVVGSVGVHVDTTVEDGGGVLANSGRDEGLATGVVLDEVGHVVDNTGNSNESLAVLGLGGEIVPADNGELLERSTPVEGGTLLVELLLQLLNTALFDLVGTELLEVIGEAEHLPEVDGPLGRVILPPLNGVSVVGGELVVEVVVTLTESNESSDEVITGRVAVVKRLVTEPVSQGVDTESSLLNEADTQDTAVDKATHPVVEQETTEEGGEDEAHEDDRLQVVLMLPDNNGVFVKVGNIGTASALRILLEDHPSQVRVEKTLANRVRILLSVGITVMSSVATRPPADRSFDGAGTDCGKVNLERQTSSV